MATDGPRGLLKSLLEEPTVQERVDYRMSRCIHPVLHEEAWAHPLFPTFVFQVAAGENVAAEETLRVIARNLDLWENNELFKGACILCGGDHDTHEHRELELRDAE